MIVYETVKFNLCMQMELRRHVSFRWAQLPEDMIKQYNFGNDNVGWEAEKMEGFQCYQCDLEPDATAEDERGIVHRVGHFRVGDWLLWWNKKDHHWESENEESLNESFAALGQTFDFTVARVSLLDGLPNVIETNARRYYWMEQPSSEDRQRKEASRIWKECRRLKVLVFPEDSSPRMIAHQKWKEMRRKEGREPPLPVYPELTCAEENVHLRGLLASASRNLNGALAEVVEEKTDNSLLRHAKAGFEAQLEVFDSFLNGQAEQKQEKLVLQQLVQDALTNAAAGTMSISSDVALKDHVILPVEVVKRLLGL